MHKFVRHSGQWYCVFLRKILPVSSTVFQQKLQLKGGPALTAGVWEALCVVEGSGVEINAVSWMKMDGTSLSMRVKRTRRSYKHQ